jgi:formate C-acetyltransferase
LLFAGFHNIPKMLEFCITGGKSLINGNVLQNRKMKSLRDFDNFEDFYQYFLSEADYFLTLALKFLDLFSESLDAAHPAYLISTMVDDCIGRGRALQAGGARYNNYGSAVLGIPNTADSLYAIKRAVFEDKLCSADELITALEANFVGHEALRKKLLALPKYGQEHDEADLFASNLSADLVRSYSSYINRFGGNGEFILLTFAWAPVAGGILGASPDGRLSGVPVAHSITPQSMSMTKGVTAAINSCSKQPFELFAGAASTMWDFDPSWATEEVIKGLVKTFFEQGGQIFQGNTTDVNELIKAQERPEDYPHLIVRVGGYSARFITLGKHLQDEVIKRLRHKS